MVDKVIMASPEARARWHAYANHCILQEHHGGASTPPTLTPSSSKPQSEDNPGGGGGGGVKPYDSLADLKRWLHHQPNNNAASFWDPSWVTLDKQEYAQIQEFEALVIINTLQKKPLVGVGEVWSEADHLLISEKPNKLSSLMESHWITINKTQPWWRTADLIHLPPFVSDKSLEQSDNHDLPRPHTNKPDQWFVPDQGLASLDQASNSTVSMPRSASTGMGESRFPSGATGCLPCGLDKPWSSTTSDEAENLLVTSHELSKAQLLEALCHSQTRAREAEKAAQQANKYKEHMITHFLGQALQLFAYKQWFHILQLETLCLQLRNKYQPIYTRFPDFVPWVPAKGKHEKRVWHKAAKTKPGSPTYKIGRSFRSFLLGFTLAGAGLLLGWTLG